MCNSVLTSTIFASLANDDDDTDKATRFADRIVAEAKPNKPSVSSPPMAFERSASKPNKHAAKLDLGGYPSLGSLAGQRGKHSLDLSSLPSSLRSLLDLHSLAFLDELWHVLQPDTSPNSDPVLNPAPSVNGNTDVNYDSGPHP